MDLATKTEVKLNAFEVPWKKSDVVLVVEGVEFHVHRPILCIQSPVFEAMLNPGFKEAKQEKITLEGKDANEMRDFLKLLYPSKTFQNPSNERNFVTMLALADEYQAEAVIKQCFDEITITPDNALKIIPFAFKYDKSVYEKCVRLAQKVIKCQNLEETIPDLEQKVRDEILIGKCKLLEDTLVEARKNLIACMNKLSQLDSDYESVLKAVCCFSHKIEIHELYKAMECEACLLAYRARFCDTAPCTAKPITGIRFSHKRQQTHPLVNTSSRLQSTTPRKNHELLKLLQDIDDLLSQRPRMTKSDFRS